MLSPMNEAEAWDFLANLWHTAYYDEKFNIYRVDRIGYAPVSTGLCYVIADLRHLGLISFSDFSSMNRKVGAVKSAVNTVNTVNRDGHKWSIYTLEGKMQRILFCDLQSQICRQEKRNGALLDHKT